MVIRRARSETDFERVDELTLEYLRWCAEQSMDMLNEPLDVAELLRHSVAERGLYTADDGRLLMAMEAEEVAGIACLKKLRGNVCEIKRMYVRPRYRGRKIGHQLLGHLIEEARTLGYSKVFLDSDPYMANAHVLYRSMGFREAAAYPESEMYGNDYAQHMIYMELEL